jgi:hypothetical protein
VTDAPESVDGVLGDPAADAEALGKKLRDFLWFCATIVKIRDKETNEVIPLVANRVQRWVWWNICDMRAQGRPAKLWILKGRQFGVTTFFCAFMWWRALVFGEGCLLLAHKELPGKRMLEKTDLMLKKLPPSLRSGSHVQPMPTIAKGGEAGTLVNYSSGGYFRRDSAEAEDPGVSENYQHGHLTEVPLWKNRQGVNRAHAIMGGLLPTFPQHAVDSTLVGEFTARGAGDYTHGVYQDAENGESEFRALFLPWYWHESYSEPKREGDRRFSSEELRFREFVARSGFEYPLGSDGKLRAKWRGKPTHLLRTFQVGYKLSDEQLLWRRNKLRGYRGDVDMWKREYPSTPDEAWQSSGRRLIASSVMDRMDVHRAEPERRGELESRIVKGVTTVRFVARDDGRLWQWRRPEAGVTYLIDADSASGVGRDYCGAHVLKLSHQRIEVVASFQGKERPHDFARLLARLGRAYRTGMVEKSPGQLDKSSGRPSILAPERNSFGEHVIHELVHNLNYGRTLVYRHEQKNQDQKVIGHVYGFPTTKATKMPMLQMLVQVCFDDVLICPCSRTLAELRSMIYLDDEDKMAGAPEGSHDDLAIPIGIGSWVAMQKRLVKRADSGGFRYDDDSGAAA